MGRERTECHTVYPDIEHPDLRIDFRAAEIAVTAACGDELFKRELDERCGTSLEAVFPSGEGVLGLGLSVVLRRIEEVDGRGAAIRILGQAIKKVDDFALNGDREGVLDALGLMRDSLRRSYRRAKKEERLACSIPVRG